MTAATSDQRMQPEPASPAPRRLRAPSWLDLRLIAGAALVVCSVVIGALVVASSDERVAVWQATRDLAPGAVLAADDVRIARVRLPSAELYLGADQPVVGASVVRQVEAGELLPRSSVGDAEPGVTVLIPVAVGDAAPVRRGERIAVWASTATCARLVVLSDVVAQEVIEPRGGALSGSSRLGIVVRVPAQLADRVIAALALPDVVLRIGVLSGQQPAEPSPLPAIGADGSVKRCEGAG